MPEPKKPMRLVPEDDPVLHRPALEIANPGQELDWMARRLALTATHHGGIAAAAPQVGHSIRLVATVAEYGLARVANPTIVEQSGNHRGTEGCLSYPGRAWIVERADRIVVEGISPLDGRPVHLQLTGMAARLWQHEIDHLDGLVLDGRFEEVELA